eukprot:2643113-Prymnesium_polylepis.1
MDAILDSKQRKLKQLRKRARLLGATFSSQIFHMEHNGWLLPDWLLVATDEELLLASAIESVVTTENLMQRSQSLDVKRAPRARAIQNKFKLLGARLVIGRNRLWACVRACGSKTGYIRIHSCTVMYKLVIILTPHAIRTYIAGARPDQVHQPNAARARHRIAHVAHHAHTRRRTARALRSGRCRGRLRARVADTVPASACVRCCGWCPRGVRD